MRSVFFKAMFLGMLILELLLFIVQK